jgi:hypothetical protein
VILHAVQFPCGKGPESSGHVMFPLGEPHHGAQFDDQHPRAVDRFGGECARHAQFQAKNIASEVKRPNLAAPVAEYLVGPHRAADDLVDVVGRLVLAVYFTVAANDIVTPVILSSGSAAADGRDIAVRPQPEAPSAG